MYSLVLVMSLESSVGLCGKLSIATISRFSSGPVVGTTIPTGVPDIVVEGVSFVAVMGVVFIVIVTIGACGKVRDVRDVQQDHTFGFCVGVDGR